MLAMGYSQNAAARRLSIAQPTIASWIHREPHGLSFQAEIRRRAELFLENLGAIEDQQIIIATQLFGRILAGEVEADAYGNLPPEYRAATELLRATRWKQRAGGHKWRPGPRD
jgi:hypothetical protein